MCGLGETNTPLPTPKGVPVPKPPVLGYAHGSLAYQTHATNIAMIIAAKYKNSTISRELTNDAISLYLRITGADIKKGTGYAEL